MEEDRGRALLGFLGGAIDQSRGGKWQAGLRVVLSEDWGALILRVGGVAGAGEDSPMNSCGVLKKLEMEDVLMMGGPGAAEDVGSRTRIRCTNPMGRRCGRGR